MKFNSYQIKSDHRDTSKIKEKSQWTISEWKEVHLFSLAKENGWGCDKGFIWSVWSVGCLPQKVGYDKDNPDLFFMKFRCDKQNQWHGYPVIPRAHDKPPSSVINAWRDGDLVTNVLANRITQGKA
jgi:hypothetical protein